MTLLTEPDLAKSEPQFLWRSPLVYERLKSGERTSFVFGSSRKHRISTVVLFVVLGAFGLTAILAGWPIYAAITPIAITGIGATSPGIVRRKKFRNCRMEIRPDACFITSIERNWELPRLTEVRVQNRWRHRDNSYIVDGDSELFLVIDEPSGGTMFFPLAHSGVLRDLDSLGADIALAAGCDVNKEYIK